MSSDWSTLLLPEMPQRGVGRALEAALRDAVRTSRLTAGTRVPATRDLAQQLGVSRGTVTAAYEQLIAEGLLTAQHGSGTRVADLRDEAMARGQDGHNQDRVFRYDLDPGRPALSGFPRAAWVRATRQAMATLPDSDLRYGDPRGLLGLRKTVLSYAARTRAVRADVDDVVIVNGVSQGEVIAARALHRLGHKAIAVEDPGHAGSARLLAATGLRVLPVPVDADGLVVDRLAASSARLVLVTPAHQSPLGVLLAPERRRALVAWAHDRGGLIIEDDYDAEHRYDRKPTSTLQSLAPDRVIYLSSLSKTLAPAIRLGWAVVPPQLRPRYADEKGMDDLGTSGLLQATVAALLAGGSYERHLRRSRSVYRQRRNALVAAISRRLPDWQITGIAAGLHVVVRLPDDVDAGELSRRAAEQGVRAPSLEEYVRGRQGPPFPGLVLGYASLTPRQLHAAVNVLADL